MVQVLDRGFLLAGGGVDGQQPIAVDIADAYDLKAVPSSGVLVKKVFWDDFAQHLAAPPSM